MVETSKKAAKGGFSRSRLGHLSTKTAEILEYNSSNNLKNMGFCLFRKNQNGVDMVDGAAVDIFVFGYKSSCIWRIFKPGIVLEKYFKGLTNFILVKFR
jgi:hypothetical protein